MTMYNPPHPGKFIKEVYLTPFNISARQAADKLKVSPSTFSRLLKGENSISPEMALRLAKALGRTPESWLAMQDTYNLWHAKKRIDLNGVERLQVGA